MLSKKKQELGDIENALDLMDGDGDGSTPILDCLNLTLAV